MAKTRVRAHLHSKGILQAHGQSKSLTCTPRVSCRLMVKAKAMQKSGFSRGNGVDNQRHLWWGGLWVLCYGFFVAWLMLIWNKSMNAFNNWEYAFDNWGIGHSPKTNSIYLQKFSSRSSNCLHSSSTQYLHCIRYKLANEPTRGVHRLSWWFPTLIWMLMIYYV